MGFLAEAGLSPFDVDDITMVIRCHPIRVAGDSGPLPGETSWEQIAAEAGLTVDIREFTTVTAKVRRVKVETTGGVFRVRQDEPAPPVGARLHRTP